MIMQLYRHIDRTNLQFDFVVHTNEKCAYDDEIEKLGGRIFRVPHFSGINIFDYRKCWRMLLKNHPEWGIVHAHMRSTASIFLSEAKKQGRYTIAHSHNTSSGKGAQNIVKNVMQTRIKYVADYFMACSDAAGEWLFGKRITQSKKYTVLKNAIDTSQFKYDESVRNLVRYNFDFDSKIVVGHIGSYITEQKNQTFLLDVFLEIFNLRQDSVLLLIGDGPRKSEIIEKAKTLGLSNSIIFTGVRSDVNELIQAMDVFVFPSYFEGLPVTLVEVQTSGLPCIISDRVPAETIITDNLVTVCSLADSPEKWANHILSRIEEPRYSRVEEIKKHGYDIEETSKWLESFYLEKCQK